MKKCICYFMILLSKNLLINFRHLYLPLFACFIIFITWANFIQFSVIAYPQIFYIPNDPHVKSIYSEVVKMYKIYASLMIVNPLICIALLYYSSGQMLNWFSKIKELLADAYAQFHSHHTPLIDSKGDRFHPSSKVRQDFILGKKVNESIFPPYTYNR